MRLRCSVCVGDKVGVVREHPSPLRNETQDLGVLPPPNFLFSSTTDRGATRSAGMQTPRSARPQPRKDGNDDNMRTQA